MQVLMCFNIKTVTFKFRDKYIFVYLFKLVIIIINIQYYT